LKVYGLARDGNEQEVVTALQKLGCTVERMHRPCDLLVGYRGRNFLIEVKAPPGPRGGTSHADLTPEQKDFRDRWVGQFSVVRSVSEALEVVLGSMPARGSSRRAKAEDPK